MDWSSALGVLGLTSAAAAVSPMLFSRTPKYSFKGKTVFLTGASQGLGRSTAVELAKAGAHVALIARNEAMLKEAVAEAKAAQLSETQKIQYFLCDVTKKDQVAAMMQRVTAAMGPPDCLIPCAGSSIPKLFLEATLEEIENQMQLNYFGTVYFTHEGAKIMKENNIPGKIVFVSSTLALTAFAGYGPYTPSKWAIRGLADTLESEFLLYGITIHHLYPPGMDTPGFKQENLVKPAMTKEIEGTAEVFTPQAVAVKLIKGVEAGHYHITCDFITYIFRVIAGGSSPRSNLFLEMLLLPLLAVVMSVVGWSSSSVVKKSKDKKDK